MKKIKFIDTILDKPQPMYMPGEFITGRVILALNEPLDVNGVLLELHGEARVGWTDTESYQHRHEDGRFETLRRTVYYRAARDYCKETIQVFGSGTLQQQPRQQLPPGTVVPLGATLADYVWPFRFQLPFGIPSSFEGQYGHIRYYVKVSLEKSAFLSVNFRQKVYMSVIGSEDCNMPQYLVPLTHDMQKRTCCWCCKGNPISMDVRIDRQAYTPLDTISIFANFDNRSSRDVQPHVELIKRVTYRAHRGYLNDWSEFWYGMNYNETRVERHVVARQNGQKVAAKSSDAWRPLQFRIPVVSPTIRTHDILWVEYELKVTCHVPMGTDLVCHFPITIGTIAYRGPPPMGFGIMPSNASLRPMAPPMSSSSTNSAFVGDDMMNGSKMPMPPSTTSFPSAPPPPTGNMLSSSDGYPTTAPPAYWELFPHPPPPQTEEEHHS